MCQKLCWDLFHLTREYHLTLKLYFLDAHFDDFFLSLRIQFLRHLQDFFGLMFKLENLISEDCEEKLRLGTEKIMLTCVGVGFTNLSKTMT